MTTTPIKTKIGNFFKGLFKKTVPILRGAAKSIPYTSALIELIDNIKAELRKDEKAHSYISIIIQFICLTIIVIAYFQDKIKLKELVETLKYMIE